MRILLTNDDGVNSPGIQLLAEALRGAGHRVFLFAPVMNHSGASHSISFLFKPCKIVEIGEDSWSCDGSPVDCVVLGLLGAIPDVPELIISGINRGANLGTDIVYSGTAAAARQGSLHNIPSLALSLAEGNVDLPNETWNWDMAVAFSVERLTEMLQYWKPCTFVNVNIPNRNEKPTALVHAFPSLMYYNDSIDIYHAQDGCRYCFARAGKVTALQEQGSDWEAVMNNNASISEVYIHPLILEQVLGRGHND
jgi:5'-nucleotidase